MTDTPTPLEDALRQRLHEHASDVPASDAMRVRVLDALEDDSWSPRRAEQTPRNGNPRPFLMLAGVAAAIAIVFGAFAIISDRADPVEVIAADPTIPGTTEAPTTEGTLQLDSARVEQVMAERSLDEPGGDWTTLSSTERVQSLEFSSSTGGESRGILRIASLPAGTTADDVVSSLSSTLFDTIVVDDSSGRIGGMDTRVVRLETQAGTSRLGFRIAADTYIEAAGTDRVFVVHTKTAENETVVFWVEASTAEIDEFEAVADRLVESLASN